MHRLWCSPPYVVLDRSRAEAFEYTAAYSRADQAARIAVFDDARPRSDLGCLAGSSAREPYGFICGGITHHLRTVLAHGHTHSRGVFSAIVGKGQRRRCRGRFATQLCGARLNPTPEMQATIP